MRSGLTGAVVVLLVAGAMGVGYEVHQRVTAKLPPGTLSTAPAVRALPAGLESRLSSFASRLHVASTGLPLAEPGTSVLYLSPSLSFAVAQFASVWSKMPPVTVVWTGTTPAAARLAWRTLGYKGDPLPSAHTVYTQAVLTVPDAYHKAGGRWMEVGGVLRSGQIKDWVRFFRGGR